jgi:predicted RNA-binding protein Jag
MPWITKEGRTVDEARDAAIAESGMLTDELDIEVVNEGAKGLFGLGGEPAVVRVRAKGEAQDFRDAFTDDITPAGDGSTPPRAIPPRPADDAAFGEGDEDDGVSDEGDDDSEGAEDAEGEGQSDEERRSLAERQEAAANLGVEIVQGILERMDVQGEITTRVAGGTVYIEIFGEEMGILIGRNGATLEALQELVRAGIQRRLKTRQAVVVDVESYWERRRAGKAERQGGDRGGRGGDREGGGGGGRGGRRGGGRGGSGGGGGGGRGRRRGGGRGGRGGPKAESGPEPDGNRVDPEPQPFDEPDGNR